MLRKYECRRTLPHYQSDYKALFVTFNTYCRWILPESARAVVFGACLYANRKRFNLHGLVVMPDHVHLVFTPLADENGPFSVAEIMQAIKSASAHRINQALRRRGYVWQQESFDRVLRREESIEMKLNMYSTIRFDQVWSECPGSIPGCGHDWVSLPSSTRCSDGRPRPSGLRRFSGTEEFLGVQPDGRGRPSLHRVCAHHPIFFLSSVMWAT
jgi:REP element-mobilizing transposase RayT